MNKAFQIAQYSKEAWRDHCKLVTTEVPEPRAGEVIVNIYLRPVNPTDLLLITLGRGVPSPSVPGSEGIGRVYKNGAGCCKFAKGQRVVAVQWPQFEGRGTWQQYVAVKEECLVAVPDDVSDEVGAQFFINPVTVVGMVAKSGVKKGDWLIQAAASSVLGRQVIELCKHEGIKTINVVRRDAAKQECLDAGGDVAISTESEDLQNRVKEVTGGAPVTAALDPVGGKMLGELFRTLGEGGKYLLYGLLSDEPAQAENVTILQSGASIQGFSVYRWIEQPHKQEMLQKTMRLLQDKVIKPFSGKHYKLEDAAEAIEASQKSGRGGKLFLKG